MKKLFFMVIALLFSCSYLYSATVEVSPRLNAKMQGLNPLEYVRVLVVLDNQVDVVTLGQQLTHNRATPQQRAYTVITTLTEHANNTQGDILNYLENQKTIGKVREIESFWIVNMVVVEANIEVLTTLANRNDVSMMDVDAELQLDRPVEEGIAEQFGESVENGIKAINAHKLWELGFKGQGTIVMGVDTGVQLQHPALSYKWRGNGRPWWQGWYDRAGTQTPTDCDNHGTHTVGTMCGRAGTDTIGVAIEAEWMAAKTICSSNHTSWSIAAWQWALNPDSNAATNDDMPIAIGNSWWDPSISNQCASVYVAALNTMEAGGVAVVFSAGNSGPGASSITAPKNINTNIINAFAVGSVDGNQAFPYPISSFSSRGPSICGGTGSLLIKPEVVAPGQNVRSANRTSGYMSMSGTSMACPHVVGAVALLKSVAPSMTGPQLLELLYNTATDLGPPGEDNTFGMGVIDVWAAFQQIGIFPLNPFTLQAPAPGTTVTTVPNGSTQVTISWDTSATGAQYKWVFGTSLPTRLLEVPSNTNSITMTTGQLDAILAGLGVAPGGSISGQWDVWAYKVNPVDSMKSSNGPRNITFTRGIPQLQSFNLVAPPNNVTIETSIFNSDPIQIRWSKSGDGTTYKWKFGAPNLSTNLLSLASDGNGFDSTLSTTYAALDGLIAGLGVNPGDSLNGQWAVYAYNGVDSLKSVQTYNITFKRSSVSALFYDDFAGGLGQWTISNDGGTCVWLTFSTPYPNAYTMPATSNPPVFTADSDECGSGTTLNSTATVADNINCTGYSNIMLEWDNDFRHFSASTIARTQVSYNGGATWETIVEWVGVSKRNSFESYPLPNATNIPNLKVRFVSIQPGWHWWWTIDNVTVKGDIMTDVQNTSSEIPESFALSQNYPNPFNPVTKINFAIPKQGMVTMKIFDITGREVASLVNDLLTPGYYSVDFNASVLSSGVYFYRLQSADFVDVKRMVLIK